MIEEIETAVAAYPWRGSYRLRPGSNSNTFVAWVARQVPVLRLDLPPTMIGKDYLGLTTFIEHAPSGTGSQLSLGGAGRLDGGSGLESGIKPARPWLRR